MSLAPLSPGVPPANPPANRVLPFSRVPPPSVPGIPGGIPLVPPPKIPLSPIPPVYLQPVDPDQPLDPDRILPPGLQIPAVPASPALPGVVDAAQDLFNPADPGWSPAPWNNPGSPASLVPPTDVPTDLWDIPFNGTNTQTYVARVVITNRRPSGTILTLNYNGFLCCIPTGWREEFRFEQSTGGQFFTYKYYWHQYIDRDGNSQEALIHRSIPIGFGNGTNGDRDIGNRKLTFIQGEELEADPDPKKVPAPILPRLFIPSSPPKIAPTPIPIPIPAPIPAPVPSPNPIPQPQPEPIPEEDPKPVIPLPIPLPVPSPQPAPVPKTAPANPAPGGNPAQPTPTPTPGPGEETQTKEPKKLPPIPFDLCDIDCLKPKDCAVIALIRDRPQVLPFQQTLDFSTSLVGQYSSPLPAGIASVSVSLSAAESRADTWGITDRGEKVGKYGTIALVLDGDPIHTYPLNRYSTVVLDIPYNLGGAYSVLVIPAAFCTASIVDSGERWRYVSVSEPELLPSVNAVNLNQG